MSDWKKVNKKLKGFTMDKKDEINRDIKMNFEIINVVHNVIYIKLIDLKKWNDILVSFTKKVNNESFLEMLSEIEIQLNMMDSNIVQIIPYCGVYDYQYIYVKISTKLEAYPMTVKIRLNTPHFTSNISCSSQFVSKNVIIPSYLTKPKYVENQPIFYKMRNKMQPGIISGITNDTKSTYVITHAKTKMVFICKNDSLHGIPSEYVINISNSNENIKTKSIKCLDSECNGTLIHTNADDIYCRKCMCFNDNNCYTCTANNAHHHWYCMDCIRNKLSIIKEYNNILTDFIGDILPTNLIQITIEFLFK